MDIRFSNKSNAVILTFLLVIFFSFTISLPLISIYYIPQSKIGSWYMNNIFYVYSMFPFLFYFMYFGIYTYNIKIDSYVVSINSYRTICSFFSNYKNYIDISHLMLEDYRFFKDRFTLNTILMLKIRTDKKIVAKRFNLSFLSSSDKKILKNSLNNVLKNK